MAVDIAGIQAHFTTTIGLMQGKLDTFYDDDKMDSELYAKTIAGLITANMQLSAQAVQQEPITDAQVSKLNADATFVATQTTELGNSVGFNNKIKALTTYADMIGTMGAGGLVISSDMWNTLFAMIANLNSNGTIAGSVSITNTNNV